MYIVSYFKYQQFFSMFLFGITGTYRYFKFGAIMLWNSKHWLNHFKYSKEFEKNKRNRQL